tara:strand:+ start:56 stop:349 length:294 start_codon:yes stop_codon:yes gene_type:complete
MKSIRLKHPAPAKTITKPTPGEASGILKNPKIGSITFTIRSLKERNKSSSADVPKPLGSAKTHGEIKIRKKLLNNLIVNTQQLLLETSFFTTLPPHA